MFCAICNRWHPRYTTSAFCMIGAGEGHNNGSSYGTTGQERAEFEAWERASDEALWNFLDSVDDEEGKAGDVE